MSSGSVRNWTNGLDAWNAANNADIFYEQVSKNPATNISLYEDDCSTCGWDGLTQYNTDIGGDYFTWAESFLNTYYTAGYVAGEAQGVATHELGHAAGLAHATGCVIMVATTAQRWSECDISTPQADDQNGINALY
jgi:predicted Zn-dependent protease